MFDHEKLEGCQLELQFVSWLTPLFQEVKASGRPRIAAVCGQLDRASLSALLNTAEGNGKRQRQVRAKFCDDARGSATECAACLPALAAKGVFEEQRIHHGEAPRARLVSILFKPVERLDSEAMLREEPTEYQVAESVPAPRLNVRHTESRTRARTKGN